MILLFYNLYFSSRNKKIAKFNIELQCFILRNMRSGVKKLPMLYNNRICSPGYSGSLVRIFASW